MWGNVMYKPEMLLLQRMLREKFGGLLHDSPSAVAAEMVRKVGESDFLCVVTLMLKASEKTEYTCILPDGSMANCFFTALKFQRADLPPHKAEAGSMIRKVVDELKLPHDLPLPK